jgi:ketosteroid isomerase-like protein
MLPKARFFPALAVFAVAAALTNGARAESRPYPVLDEHDRQVIDALITRMESSNLDSLPAMELAPYSLPGASVDVMRVRMDETYNIQGIGNDTVELRGWIAVVHDRPMSVVPNAAPTWETAITPTEFVGLHLKGKSKIFGDVEVKLDDTMRVRGAVGAVYMPFMQQVMADLSYRDLRGDHPELSPVYVARLMPIEYRWRNGAVPVLAADDHGEKDQAQIQKIIRDVLAAINAKDAKKMLSHYTTEQGAFFGPNDAVFTNTKAYAAALGQIFENLKSVKATPNDDVAIRVTGNTAVAHLTGTNVVVDKAGHSSTSPWRWSLQFEREKSTWKVAGEHLSFITPRSTEEKGAFHTELFNLKGDKLPIGNAGGMNLAPGIDLTNALSVAKCNCQAAVSVKVFMPNLLLAMRTSSPVQWYSEVTSIPPIGETASKTINTAPLESGSREVGSLLSGLVKFREVVARETLHGTSSKPGTVAVR